MAEIHAPGFKSSPMIAVEGDKKLTPQQAGYMELRGAVKDAGCEIVSVPGGVSSERGCCNNFEPQGKGTESFKCGVCEYLELNARGKE